MSTNELSPEIERIKALNERLKILNERLVTLNENLLTENEYLKNEIILLRGIIEQSQGITPGKPKAYLLNQSSDILQQSQNRRIGDRRIKL